MEYIDAIQDIRCLGSTGATISIRPDHFEQLYVWAEYLIEKGLPTRTT